MSTNKAKTLIGLALIAISVFSLVLWEVEGREMLLMDKVLIVNNDISKDQILTTDMFSEISVPKEAVVKDALLPAEIGSLEGKTAGTILYKGSQVSKKHIVFESSPKKSSLSYFVIPNEWIYMCSSALRASDEIEIISKDGGIVFGKYEIAFVKDSEGKEVVSRGIDAGAIFNSDVSGSSNSSPINHVEIICEVEDYLTLKNYAEKDSSGSFIFIKRGEGIE